MAGRFAKLGIVDGKGQPPTPVLIRRTWLKVNRAKELVALGAVPPRRRGKTPAVAAGHPASQAQPSPSPANASPSTNLGMLPHGIEPTKEEPRRYKFEFASAKDWTKEPNKGDE